jgi:hypothetical protein
MSIQSQLVVSGHLPVEVICRRLLSAAGVTDVVARPMRAKEHWLLEVTGQGAALDAIDAFLFSYAASDYAELNLAESTLLTMPAGPNSRAYLEAVGDGSAAWFRASEGEGWQDLAAA